MLLDSGRFGDRLFSIACTLLAAGLLRALNANLHQRGRCIMNGKKNMVFGFVYLLAATVLSLYFGDRASASGTLLSSAFLQANLDAALNLGGGYLISRLPFVDWLSRTISVLLMAGALLHSGMLYVSGIGLLPVAAVLMPLGVAIMAAVALFMGIGVLSLRAVR
jgi:hypothetical protein